MNQHRHRRPSRCPRLSQLLLLCASAAACIDNTPTSSSLLSSVKSSDHDRTKPSLSVRSLLCIRKSVSIPRHHHHHHHFWSSQLYPMSVCLSADCWPLPGNTRSSQSLLLESFNFLLSISGILGFDFRFNWPRWFDHFKIVLVVAKY